jgi:PAS domain S-box-containing protein
VDILKTYTPDIIFVDLVMPDIDGKQLLKIIRSMPELKDVRIVILSAIAAEEDLKIKEFRADARIAKGPVNDMAKQVVAIVDRLGLTPTKGLPGETIGVQGLFPRNITKELLSIKNHFEIILGKISEGVLEVTSEGRIVYTNSIALSIIGIPEEKLLGSHFIDLFSAADRHRVAELAESSGDKPQKTIGEFFFGLNGRKVTLQFLPIVEYSATSLVIINDITGRLQAQEELQEERNKLQSIVGAIGDGLSIQDLDYNISYQNDVLKDLFGDRVGEKCYLVYEGKDMVCDGCPVEMAYKDGNSHSSERSVIMPSGGITFWENIANPIRDAGGEIISCLEIARNITDRKQAEEALRESEYELLIAQRLAGLGSWTYDSVSQQPTWSEGMFNIWGLSPKDGAPKYTDQEKLIHPDDYPRFDAAVREAVELGKPYELDLRICRPDGVEKTIITICEPKCDEVGNVVKLRGTIQDITERKKAEEQKAKLESQLQQAQKMESIGSLAGGIAHDLNNILFPISGFSEMLLDEIPPDNHTRESIEQIYKSAKRGSDLVNQILAFSRQSNLQKLPIRIQPILKEVLKLVRATIPKNIELANHIDKDCGRVSADPTQIHQIAMNLITNAYHAVEEKGGSINIELKETVFEKDDLIKPGKYVVLTVSDTGTGIDQSLIDKIFDPYFTTKVQGKGTGLGLSVVHGIVKEHGGDIRVYSEIGKGTVFHVYLPLLGNAMDSKAAAITRKYPTGHERILLVDDEEPIVCMEQIMLERLGYKVTVRTSSPDALEAFRADPSKFDLVISDRGMPNMTGEQLARELISIRPDIPFIICTGFSDENDEQHARAMGIKGFLRKPVATGDLAEMVRNVLDEAKGTTPQYVIRMLSIHFPIFLWIQMQSLIDTEIRSLE